MRLAFVAVLLLLARPAAAQGADPFFDPGAPAGDVDAVPVLVDLAPTTNTVFTGEELVRRGYRTVGEALHDVVGLLRFPTPRGVRTGARGVPAGIALVVDGVPQVSDGERDLLDVDLGLDLQDVERVEIVRGATTALTGVGALTGVVRITTRRPGLGGASVRATLAGPLRGPLPGAQPGAVDDGGAPPATPLDGEVAAAAAGSLAGVDARLTLRLRRGPAPRYTFDAVPTRFESIGGAVVPVTKERLTVDAPADDTLTARLALSHGDTLVDLWHLRTLEHHPLSSFSHALGNTPQSRARDVDRLRLLWRRFVGSVAVEVAATGTHTVRDELIPLYPVSGIFRDGGSIDIQTVATTFAGYARVDVPLSRDHRLTFGAFGDAARSRAETNSRNPVDGSVRRLLVTDAALTSTLQGAVEYQGDFPWGFHLTAGGVALLHTAFAPALAPRAALSWHGDLLSTTLSYAEGIRAPDRFDAAALAQAVVGGNVTGAAPPDVLLPERVRTAELSLSLSPSARLDLTATTFALRHEDAVVNVIEGASLVPANLAPRHAAGVEAGFDVEAVRRLLRVKGGATVVRALDLDADGPDQAIDLGYDNAQLTAQLIATPLPFVELGARHRAFWLFGEDAAAGAQGAFDLWASATFDDDSALGSALRTDGPGLALVLALKGIGAARARDTAALPAAVDLALPGAGPVLQLSVEGHL